MPIILKDSYFLPIQNDIESLFYETLWKPIIDAVGESKSLLNSKSDLISALRSGKVSYSDGVFSGKFNAAISRELRKFAKFDKRSKTWKGNPPPDIKGIAITANDRVKAMAKKIESIIDTFPERMEEALDSAQYRIAQASSKINTQADKDIKGLGITPDITPEIEDRLIDEYRNNLNLSIDGWTPEQTARLRDMIKEQALKGYSRPALIDAIRGEYEVTKNKAKFWARQETSLFTSKLRESRYTSAGIEYYRWSTSNDSRVVGAPGGLYPEGSPGHGLHANMQGKICRFDDASIYADSVDDARKGKWKSKAMIGVESKHPGEAWNCRCVSIAIIL